MKKKRLLTLMAMAVMAVGAWAQEPTPTMKLTFAFVGGSTVINNVSMETTDNGGHWSLSSDITLAENQKNRLMYCKATYNSGLPEASNQTSGNCYIILPDSKTVKFYAKYVEGKVLVSSDAMEIAFSDYKWRRLGIVKPSVGNASSSTILNVYDSSSKDYNLLSGYIGDPQMYYLAGCKYSGSDRKVATCDFNYNDNHSYAADKIKLTIPKGIYRATITYAECLIELVPVTTFPLTIGTAEAATLCLPYEVTLPAELTAYTLTSNGTTTLTGAKDDDNVIPANTPVLVTGPANNYNITLPDAAASYITESMDGNLFLKDAEPDDGNALHGVMAPHYVRTTGVNYVLQKNNGNLGFYKVSDDPSTCTYLINPFRAFVNLAIEPAGARGLSIVFDDSETTGIADVKGQKEDVRSDIFNLSGQRVGKDYKGVVIKNGRKMIQK